MIQQELFGIDHMALHKKLNTFNIDIEDNIVDVFSGRTHEYVGSLWRRTVVKKLLVVFWIRYQGRSHPIAGVGWPPQLPSCTSYNPPSSFDHYLSVSDLTSVIMA
jgi:hypothetical protein